MSIVESGVLTECFAVYMTGQKYCSFQSADSRMNRNMLLQNLFVSSGRVDDFSMQVPGLKVSFWIQLCQVVLVLSCWFYRYRSESILVGMLITLEREVVHLYIMCYSSASYPLYAFSRSFSPIHLVFPHLCLCHPYCRQ